jgi:Reverse transcriptase (RNA-dependent DNA polymerase)
MFCRKALQPRHNDEENANGNHRNDGSSDSFRIEVNFGHLFESTSVQSGAEGAIGLLFHGPGRKEYFRVSWNFRCWDWIPYLILLHSIVFILDRSFPEDQYQAAMESSDAAHWKTAVEDEYNRMEENKVWDPIPTSEVPRNAKVLSSTWAMKKKANGTFRARLNARGFEQVPGIHYDPKTLAAPVVAMLTIRIVFIIMLVAGWSGHVIDVRGAFLKGDFGDGETLYMHLPQGMEKWYGSNVYLLLGKTLYGLKQAAYRF